MSKYVGMICPGCMNTIGESDKLAVCKGCGFPHHMDCWTKNGKCNMPVCGGSEFSELLPYTPAEEKPKAQEAKSEAVEVKPVVAEVKPVAAPAFCRHCGAKLVEGDKFCRGCGQKIEAAEAPKATPTPAVTPNPSSADDKKRQYDQGVILLQMGKYDEALQIFKNIADYADAKQKARECLFGKENAQKDNLYITAIGVLAVDNPSEEYLNNSIEILKSLGDYKDSKAKISEMKKAIHAIHEGIKAQEEAVKQQQYENAKALLEGGAFDQAIAIFTALGDFADSAKQIEKCNKAKEEAFKENSYNTAVAVLTAEKLTEDEIKGAIESLKALKGYRDSSDKVKEVEARLKKWYADRDAAIEAEKLRKAQKKAKAKKTTAIIIISVVIAAVVAALIALMLHPFTIKYNLDGGSVSIRNATTYKLLDKDIKLNNPTKEGYTFAGWTGTGLDSPTIDVVISGGSLGNREYTATWAPYQSKITFNLDGGSLNTQSMTAEYGTSVQLPTPTKNGYTFDGWYAGSRKYNGGNWTEKSDISLTAKWIPNSYTITLENSIYYGDSVVVTFDYNDSHSAATEVTLANGEILEYPEIPTRSGYVFAGWYTDSDCYNEFTFSGEITHNMTLYAGWNTVYEENDYYYPWNVSGDSLTSTNKFDNSISCYTIVANVPMDVSFYYGTSSENGCDQLYIQLNNWNTLYTCSGYSEGNYAHVSMSAGDTLTFTYSKDGSVSNGNDCAYITDLTFNSGVYYFSTATAVCRENVGYEYSDDSTAEFTVTFDSEYTLPVLTRRGYSFLGWYNGDVKVENGVWTNSSSVTLTPMWEVGGNTITLDANGGNVASSSVNVRYDQSFTLPTPTRTGYTFEGWYSGNTEYVSGVWTELDDITLVARWTANTYSITFEDVVEHLGEINVTFNYNYSGSTPTVQTLRNGQTLTYPTNPTRSGYVFAGWYSNSACTTQYNFSGTIYRDMTLYAKWVSCDISNDYSYPWTVSGSSLTSTNKRDNSTSNYTITVYSAVTVTFRYKTSSESGYDKLYVKKNGSSLFNCSGSTSYVSYSINLSSGDTLTFTYSKDGSASNGSDCAYITDLSFAPVVTSTAAASCSEVSEFAYEAGSVCNKEVTYDSAFTLPVPTRRGYSFLGWFSGETKIEDGVWRYDANLILTARWAVGGNTITLNPDGGSVPSTSIPVMYDSTYTLPTPTRTGYTFLGWYNGNIQYVSGFWTGLYDITLVARWEANTYTVTYADSVESPADVMVTFNYNYPGSVDTLTILTDGEVLQYPTNPVRSGYLFAGWYTDSSCTTQYHFSGTIEEDMTLYAKWVTYTTSNDYSYPWSVSGSSLTSTNKRNSSTSSYTITVYSSVTVTFRYKTSSESGYDRLYVKKNGSNLFNCSGITSYSSYSVNLSAGDTLTFTYSKDGSQASGSDCAYITDLSFTSNVSYYSSAIAQCSQVGGLAYSAGNTYSVQVEYGSEYHLLGITREGYTFLGWYNGETLVNSGDWCIDSDVTLVARWG